ncbi:MAG: hypothetical protein DI616_04600 [Paracoccus denitrificans]|uniref:Uncharacterized protein n=1 Tax=Paracoccus denitrificans TaxID=266 RepID=A0A533I7Y3_PARDE|nr:MAG: hypothetical protein DI616_04600 [Paracoccus denitrificans]
MRRILTALAGLVCAASPGSAQDESSTLRDAMAFLPEAIFNASSRDLGHFVDVAIQAPRGRNDLPGLAFLQQMPASQLRPVSSLAMAAMQSGLEEWSENAGADLADIRYFAGFGTPPEDVTIWGFTDEASAGATFAGLEERGFTEIDGMAGVMANGEPLQINIANRDPANPWTGQMGQTSVVTRQRAHLLHAAGPTAFEPLLQGQASMVESAPGKSLLAALLAQEKPVAQATFFGPQLGFYSPQPGPMPDPMSSPEDNAAIKAEMEKSQAGVPVYFGGVVADLVQEGKTVAVIALAYPDCATAEKAAARAAALWPESGGDAPETTVSASHVDAGGAGCAAVLSVEAPDSIESAFGLTAGRILRQDLASVRIGQ